MDTAQILAQLATVDVLPEEAIRAARLQKPALIPEFIALLESHAAGTRDWRDEPDLLFLVFHLLGEWQEKSAYRTLLRFLRSPAVESLGDAIIDTSYRVIAAVFDGDTGPLRDLVLDPDADEFARAMMFEAMALLDFAGKIRREETTNFLRDCFGALKDEQGSFVWNGWQRAIAVLGIHELLPLVKEVFERRFIDPMQMSFHDFEEDMDAALKDRDAAPKEWVPFRDTLEELRDWYDTGEDYSSLDDREKAFSSVVDVVLHRLSDEERATLNAMSAAERLAFLAQLKQAFDDCTTDSYEPVADHHRADKPAVNPHRAVGRNDPCPCGSGRKFKKCCLAQAA
jgi:hypothetical protein